VDSRVRRRAWRSSGECWRYRPIASHTASTPTPLEASVFRIGGRQSLRTEGLERQAVRK
jgi:hypothetical protein